MSLYLSLITCFLVILLFVGLWIILMGPTTADRMMISQFFGTTGVAILLLLTVIQEQQSILNVALVLALLASLTTVTFISLTSKE